MRQILLQVQGKSGGYCGIIKFVHSEFASHRRIYLFHMCTICDALDLRDWMDALQQQYDRDGMSSCRNSHFFRQIGI